MQKGPEALLVILFEIKPSNEVLGLIMCGIAPVARFHGTDPIFRLESDYGNPVKRAEADQVVSGFLQEPIAAAFVAFENDAVMQLPSAPLAHTDRFVWQLEFFFAVVQHSAYIAHGFPP